MNPTSEKQQMVALLALRVMDNHRESRDAIVVDQTLHALHGGKFFEADLIELATSHFVQVMVEIMLDKYLCGYKANELTSLDRNTNKFHRVTSYLTSSVYLAHSVIDASVRAIKEKVVKASTRPTVQANIDFVMKKMPRVWQAIWNIKTPFIDQMALRVPDLHNHLVYLGVRHIDAGEFRPGTLVREPGQLGNVMFAVWVYADSVDVRSKARIAAWTVYDTTTSENQADAMVAVRRGAATSASGGIPSDHIAAAFLRDLKSKDCADSVLSETLNAMNHYVSPGPYMLIKERPEYSHALLVHLLANCRRDICKADQSQLPKLRSNISALTLYLVCVVPYHNKNIARLPKSFAYGTIPILCDYIVHMVQTDLRSYDPMCVPLSGILKECCDLLRFRARLSNASTTARKKREMLRRISRTSQRAAAQAIGTQPIHHSEWQIVLKYLDTLGKYLKEDDVGAEDLNVSPWSPLKRCRRPDCLCSVHKPKHALRICHGCWSVAYCNEVCQAKDWPAHATWCRQIRVGGSG